MNFTKVALLLTTGVVLLCGLSEGCTWDVCQQLYNESTAMNTSTGINLDAFCKGLPAVKTCLDSSNNTDCVGEDYFQLQMIKYTLNSSITSCDQYTNASSTCRAQLQNCRGVDMRMVAAMGADNSSICVLEKTRTDCYRTLSSMCPDLYLEFQSGISFNMSLSLTKMCRQSSIVGECPDVDQCLNDMCQDVTKSLQCITDACPSISDSQDPPLNSLIPMVTYMCTYDKKYPTLSSCSTYRTCTHYSIPSTTGTTFDEFASSDNWCRLAVGREICSREEVKANACGLPSSFSKDVATFQSKVDSTCQGVRVPCLDAVKCLDIPYDGPAASVIARCRGVRPIANCFIAALKTCGPASEVKAEYSLTDIAEKYDEYCKVITDNADDIGRCSSATNCLSSPQGGPYEILEQDTDPRYWADFLKDMMNCTSRCELSPTVTQQLTTITADVTELTKQNSADITVSNLMLISSMVTFLLLK